MELTARVRTARRPLPTAMAIALDHGGILADPTDPSHRADLAEFGIDKGEYFEKIPVMISQAIASGSPNNNPRVATTDEIAGIYNRAVYMDERRRALEAWYRCQPVLGEAVHQKPIRSGMGE